MSEILLNCLVIYNGVGFFKRHPVNDTVSVTFIRLRGPLTVEFSRQDVGLLVVVLRW